MWYLRFFLLMSVVVNVSCSSSSTELPTLPKESHIPKPSVTPDGKSSSFCRPMDNQGLPVDPDIQDTHIIYFGENTLGQGSNSGQIGLISLKSGESKVLIDSPDFRILGLAFLS